MLTRKKALRKKNDVVLVKGLQVTPEFSNYYIFFFFANGFELHFIASPPCPVKKINKITI